MIVEDQSAVVDFLRGHRAEPGAEPIVTHASMIFLKGGRACKLKRAVRFPYLDYSTAEQRLAACVSELELNRRTAPQLYLGVETITRDPDGGFAFGGTGSLVDAVVEMRRFEEDALFDSMAQRGALTPAIMTDLARRVAAFHYEAPVSMDRGGAAGIADVLDINDRALRATGLVPDDAADAFASAFRQAFEQHRTLLESRREMGKVRRCHGDLILRNICLLDGEPTLFDCIEFSDDIATIDALYDLAFLLMDLWHREQRELANLVFNRYLDENDDTDGLPLIPFFMAVRAAVRAHVTAAQAMDLSPDRAAPVQEEAQSYFDLARSLLQPAEPILLAIGGLSGSGKSTLAASLAPHLGPAPGARVLSSDRIRKRLHGVPAEERLSEEAYRPEVSKRVYAALRQQTARVIDMRYAVIADAVFDQCDERAAIESTAENAAAPFHGIWLEASPAALISRVMSRKSDPSDATAEIVRLQLEKLRGDITWQRIDAGRQPASVRDAILSAIRS
jgi:aminoglycoside phosphotransferase family enzyme/predicted kinase